MQSAVQMKKIPRGEDIGDLRGSSILRGFQNTLDSLHWLSSPLGRSQRTSVVFNADSLLPHSHPQKQVHDVLLNMQVVQPPLQSAHLESACAAAGRTLIQV